MDQEQQPTPTTTLFCHHYTIPEEQGPVLHVRCDRGDDLQVQFRSFSKASDVVRARDDLASMVQTQSEKGRCYHVHVIRVNNTMRYAVFVTDTPLSMSHWTGFNDERVLPKEATEWVL